jgi:hypothetical protein
MHMLLLVVEVEVAVEAIVFEVGIATDLQEK